MCLRGHSYSNHRTNIGGVGFESNREGKWRRRVLLSEAEGGKYRKGWEVGKTARRMFEKAQGCMLLTISLFKNYNARRNSVYKHMYLLLITFSFGLTLLPPSTKDHLTNPNTSNEEPSVEWMAKAKRLPKHSTYCCCLWLPPRGGRLSPYY